MYIEAVPNRNSPPAVLLRESYRDESGKVKKRTLANLSCLKPDLIDLMRRHLKGEAFISPGEAFKITDSKAHGHVEAVLEAMRRLKIAELLDPQPRAERNQVMAMIATRILAPHPKLSTIRFWRTTTLPEELGVQDADDDDLYSAMDWLLERQTRIEAVLSKRHLRQGEYVFYDLSSSYYEGQHCPLAEYGYSRDKKRGKRQINYGLLTDKDGRPICINAWPGNVSDSSTFMPMLERVRDDFGISEIVLVGDRGMLSSKNIDELREKEHLGWITALRSSSLRALVGQTGLQLSLFDERNLFEFTAPEYPGERLVACRNPFLADQRGRVREELLSAAEKDLGKVRDRVAVGRLKTAGQIGLAVGRVIDRRKMKKHFLLEVSDGHFDFRRHEESIAQEAALDGIYVLRTSVESGKLGTAECVRQYKKLSQVERAFRTLKMAGLQIRPIHHRLDGRVRAHIFLCMLSYYVEWHMREVWREQTFADEEQTHKETRDPVAPAQKSESAKKKTSRKKTADGAIVHSFKSLLADLSTIIRNVCQVLPASNADREVISITTTPSSNQQKAFDLLKNIKL
ncbi:MAG: IS1634 family transposase [Planctomycetes bacterium]|nr:IS1634 family transposase [Planctomycetota bacterium]